MTNPMLDEISDRRSAVDLVGFYLGAYVRDGNCDARVIVSNVSREEWETWPYKTVQRFPEGPVKVETLIGGITVEWVPEVES